MYLGTTTRNILLVLVLGISFSSFLFTFESDGILSVTFFDVGQGDSIFIETPNDIQILIDGGPDGTVVRELSNTLPFYDRSIDVVIATHPDKDHIGGIPDVLKAYDVSVFVEPGVASAIGEYRYIQDYVNNADIQRIVISKPIRIEVSDHVYVDILFPDRDASGLESNAASIIAQLVYGEHEFLFTGDSPSSIEKYITYKYGSRLHSDVLKVGHHGSKTSTDKVFIDVVSPTYSVISAGSDNRYGHPHVSVLETLSQSHVLGTYERGTIRFTSDGKVLSVE